MSASERRRRRDSNNFDTAESVYSSDDESDQENNFIDSRRGSNASSVSEGRLDDISRMAQGSPWNDNFLTETMMGRPETSRSDSKIGRPRNLDEDGDVPVDLNSLYVKGERIIPLDSPIKCES